MNKSISDNINEKKASLFRSFAATAVFASAVVFSTQSSAEEVTIGIGTQNTTTNTVTGVLSSRN